MDRDKFANLLLSAETTDLDWKADFTEGLLAGKSSPEYVKSKGTLLKDIAAMANAIGNTEFGYLVFGVKDDQGSRTVTGISKNFDDANFQSWAKTFDPPIVFTYAEVAWEPSKTVGIFEIRRIPEYPHVTVTTFKDIMYEGQVWFRQGTQNRVAHREVLRTMLLGETPFKFSTTIDPEFDKIVALYEEQGEPVKLPKFHDRDSLLARCYRLAYYPGTRREMWVGHHNREFDHIAMHAPKE